MQVRPATQFVTGQGTITGTSRWQSKGDTLETTISNLLRSLAEAIRPFLGLDSIAAVDPGDIEGLDDLVEESVGNYIENEGVMTTSSFDPDDYDLVTERNFDPSSFDLLDETDIGYLIDQKVSDEVEGEVESWLENNLEDAIESSMRDALVVQPAGLYTSDEFLDAVEAAVRATLAGITFTVQANVPQPEVHLDGHSGDDVVVAGV